MNESPAPWKQLASPPFILTLIMLGIIGYVVYVVLEPASKYASETQALVIGAILVQGIAEIRKFWFNSDSESVKKNDTIATQAKVIETQTGTGNGNSPKE